jgi:hypothetical protein
MGLFHQSLTQSTHVSLSISISSFLSKNRLSKASHHPPSTTSGPIAHAFHNLIPLSQVILSQSGPPSIVKTLLFILLLCLPTIVNTKGANDLARQGGAVGNNADEREGVYGVPVPSPLLLCRVQNSERSEERKKGPRPRLPEACVLCCCCCCCCCRSAPAAVCYALLRHFMRSCPTNLRRATKPASPTGAICLAASFLSSVTIVSIASLPCRLRPFLS